MADQVGIKANDDKATSTSAALTGSSSEYDFSLYDIAIYA